MVVKHLILCLLVCANGNGLSPRIIGGRDAEDSAYPYQVSLRVYGDHKCGGSLLDHQWVLTAAHCIIKHNVSLITIVLGSNNVLTGGIAYHAEYVIVHPDYNRTTRTNDLGLIKIAGYAKYSESIAPIALPREDINPNGCTNCTAMFTGWGNTGLNGATNNDLQVIKLRVIGLTECRKTFPAIKDTNLCTLTEAGQGLCYGDSGSPLVAGNAQIAIGSWGSPCALGYPDVHTRVYKYVDWIKAHINYTEEAFNRNRLS